MQSRDNQHVEDPGLLKIRGFVTIQKATVAKEHCTEDRCDFWPRSKQHVEFILQALPRSSQ